MSNILTDILGFFKRRKFVEQAKDSDVLILGVNESPDMLGIASPVPYKDVKLITVKSLLGSNLDVLYQNIGSGSEVYAGQSTVGDQKYENFRSLKSVSLNLTINQTASEIQFNTTAEPNTAANVGSGAELYKNKVGETLNFRSIISSDASVGITQSTNEIDLTVSGSGEVNTASNLGTGQGLFKQKSGVDLQFYSLTSSDSSVDIDLITQDNVIDLKSTGEANTASNVGGQTGLFKGKTGVDLEFKTLEAGTNVTFDTTTTDVIKINSSGGNTSDYEYLQGGRFKWTEDSNITDFNTTITGVTQYGNGYYNLPDISGSPTGLLEPVIFGDKTSLGQFAVSVRTNNNGPGSGTFVVDYKAISSDSIIKFTFKCYAHVTVPPTVIYLGLHCRNATTPITSNSDIEYGWQAVGVDPDTNNQITQIQATWCIKQSELKDSLGRLLNDPAATNDVEFHLLAGSNAGSSGADELFFGAQWNADIPTQVDFPWVGPATYDIELIDGTNNQRFFDNPSQIYE